MNLNLGCGDRPRKDYDNYDLFPVNNSIKKLDVSDTPWPFEDNSAERILMRDVIEHLLWSKHEPVIKECFRVLAPGGVLELKTPNFRWIVDCYLEQKMVMKRTSKAIFWLHEIPGWGHVSIHDDVSLRELLASCDFTVVSCNRLHTKSYDMIIKAVKSRVRIDKFLGGD